MAQKKAAKPWPKMTPAELEEATREFDKPLPADKLKPLSTKQRAMWDKARRGGRASSKRGQTAVVLVRVDADLLEAADAYANKHNMERSELIERSLRSALTFVQE